MAARQSHTSMNSLASMGAAEHSPLFWVDKEIPGPRERSLINTLGLELPAGEQYGLSIRGGQLIISGADRGITNYRLSHNIASGIEGTHEGIVIHISGASGINSVLLKNSPCPIPRHATNHSATDAPISLLDEYAQLRGKEQSHSLTQGEIQRKTALLREIGSEYRRLHNEKDYDSYRSTPSSSGESRGGGSCGRPG